MSRNKFFSIILLIAFLAGGFWIYKNPNLVYLFAAKPCSSPIQYSLGTFDNQFHISQTDFLSAVDEASNIWETSINKDLFVYSASGKLKINLIYDSRQEATDRLKKLGITIDDSQSSYNNLKAQYNLETSRYNVQKASLEAAIQQYERDRQAYEAQVAFWNARGGAPKNEYDKLQAQQASLNEQANAINQKKDALNRLVDDINALANILNNLARQLNLNVAQYNTVGKTLGDEFEEGVYVSDSNGQHIDIYEFTDNDQLVRVLAHELGHALGLPHVDDPNAIMYRLNSSKNDAPTSVDIGELKQVCRL